MALFDLLSLFYAILGIRAIITTARNWRAFSDDELTAADRRLASELAFFVFIPVGVFLHELGHVVATLQAGGQVARFHYALFYGYVVPRGEFTLLQDWWISLSGNLVSVVFGFSPLIFLRAIQPVWLKYTLLTFMRIQLGWSLIGYPLLTLAGFQGDWIWIYTTHWLLTVPTALVHASLVIGLWLLDQSPFVRRWEVGWYAGAREELKRLDRAIAARPGSVDPIIERGNYFAASEQPELAVADYRAALRLDPQNPRALYNIGQVCLLQRNFAQAEKHFRSALARAGAERSLAGRVRFGLGLSFHHSGKTRAAVREFDAAIERDPAVPEYYFWRGTAYRSLRDVPRARADLARAAELAARTAPELAARANELLTN